MSRSHDNYSTPCYPVPSSPVISDSEQDPLNWNGFAGMPAPSSLADFTCSIFNLSRFFHTINSWRKIFTASFGPLATQALKLIHLPPDSATFGPTSFQFNQEDKDPRRMDSNTGGSLPDYRGILYPATISMLPAFVIANYVADAHCGGQLASFFLHQSFQRRVLTTSDCNFVFQKLCMYAPHLLGTELTLPTDLPCSAIVPCRSSCPTCVPHARNIFDFWPG